MKPWMNYVYKVPAILQGILNVTLVLVGFTLTFFLLKETWYIFSFMFIDSDVGKTDYEFTEQLLVFFLYFEFIALIIQYFKSGFHFPLRYFIYIGITAIIRLIIIDYTNASNTLLWSISIAVLLGALVLANMKVMRRDEH
ncbi:phosphate-starvation-inducible protein PsiE [Paenibacillus sp. PK4536]|uniref:Protein PsiE n=1 Tax=Paenibacillus nuruki TaxID=1886670 RepID=A0A1E3L9S6_9BACL|nr:MULTISPECIES: phosphate-starvation-inducible protein PsiE [Paenibacillus]ODP30539.1 Protein PsiE like protein [Paenibacillus nuruki]TKJ90140.1 phosphate-starvation-inducible protein PsiE [Paenibacillus sp. CFBP13512]WIM39387.1 phosphate-starvation-inducible protein PsiE [Paenibacillus sp. PK4536]CAJ1313898.1 phosphate-starvation-inducible protein PsiE [Paenibacillus nuruki]